MAQNPINIGQRGDTIDFIIPAEHRNTMLYLTLKTELLDEGWQYQAIHKVYVNGVNKFKDSQKEPEDIKLDHALKLEGLKMAVQSRVDRIRNGSEENVPSRVKYSLILEAGDILLESYDATCDETNPEEFFAQIRFKNQ